MLERAGLSRKPVLHCSKEKTNCMIISDGKEAEIGEQMLFVARESI